MGKAYEILESKLKAYSSFKLYLMQKSMNPKKRTHIELFIVNNDYKLFD